MRISETVSIIGLIGGLVFGSIQTYALLVARAETIEVTRTIAEAAQATAESIGGCNENTR